MLICHDFLPFLKFCLINRDFPKTDHQRRFSSPFLQAASVSGVIYTPAICVCQEKIVVILLYTFAGKRHWNRGCSSFHSGPQKFCGPLQKSLPSHQAEPSVTIREPGLIFCSPRRPSEACLFPPKGWRLRRRRRYRFLHRRRWGGRFRWRDDRRRHPVRR